MAASDKIKEISCSIQLPLTFNCWKHHADFIKKQIEFYRGAKISVNELQKTLLVIGESQMDLYYGKLSPQEICDELVSKLKSTGVLAFEEYKNWLFKKGKDYKLTEISDHSVWALRLGKQKERYIHIHPGRYSPFTLRVKALTLKTAIAVLIINYKKNIPLMDTLKINEVRKKILNSPPINKVSSNSAVLRVINILSDLKVFY
jgi:hypothetical protein